MDYERRVGMRRKKEIGEIFSGSRRGNVRKAGFPENFTMFPEVFLLFSIAQI